MKKGAEKSSISGISPSSSRKLAKIFLINIHSAMLESFETRLVRIVELGACKKIVPIKVKPNAPGSSLDDIRLVRQIVEGIEKARKQMEAIWKSLKRDMESEIWTQWMQSMEEAKTKDDKAASAKTRRRSPDAPTIANPQTGQKDYAEDAEEQEDEAPPPGLFPRLVTTDDMKTLYSELRSRDLNIAEYYMLIFCNTTTVLIKDLLQLGVTPSAVIHFIPCQVSELETQFPDVFADIQEFKKCPETKQIALFTSCLNIESLIEPDLADIYDQFKSYLFDIEMLTQHYYIYHSDFVEISDALPEQENLWRPIKIESNNHSSDNTAVYVYFDNLCRMVETHKTKERRYSSFHPRPFIDNDYGKIIIEEANELLQSTIATQMNLVSYWKAVEIVCNSMRHYTTQKQGLTENIKLPRNIELLSWESFAQRIDMMKKAYDYCYREDLSEKFKFFTFRRTFNKVLTTHNKYNLPTRLCLRDFCDYMIPEYVQLLRRRSESSASLALAPDLEDESLTMDTNLEPSQIAEEEQQKPRFFSGLTFDDTLQELTVIEQMYRFHRMGYIRVKQENWMYKERRLTVQIKLFKCFIYAHHCDEYLPIWFPRVRIVFENGITCNVEMTEDPAQPYISMLWRNDCQIRYIGENGISAVEQRHHSENEKEFKRVYTQKGCVLIYLRNGVVNALTPNGVCYQLFPRDYVDPESPDEFRDPKPLHSENISIELAFVESLKDYGINCTFFDVTRNDGRKIRVLDGVAIGETAQYLVYEWMDLGYGEMFAERDDGVKMVSSYYGLKTFFPCGTMIHSVAEEEYIEIDLNCRSPSTENILRKINPDIIKRLDDNRVRRELWLRVDLTCHVHHEKYASITCSEETGMIIQSPEDIKITVSPDCVVIDVGLKVSLRFAMDLCTITSEHDNDMSIKLNLIPIEGEVLCYQSDNARVSLKENGQLVNENTFGPPDPVDEDVYLASRRYKFGVAFLPNYEFDMIVKQNRKSRLFYETPKKVVFMKVLQPLSERFSMPIPGYRSILDKLLINKCRRANNDHTPEEIVLSMRAIFKLQSIPQDMQTFLEAYTYIEMTLSDTIQDALEYWFAPKRIKSKYSRAWQEKIRNTADEMKRNKQRAPVYHAMIKHKVFPKYHEFVAARHDVDNINLRKLMPKLKEKGFKNF